METNEQLDTGVMRADGDADAHSGHDTDDAQLCAEDDCPCGKPNGEHAHNCACDTANLP